jgi:hypothetical protein
MNSRVSFEHPPRRRRSSGDPRVNDPGVMARFAGERRSRYQLGYFEESPVHRGLLAAHQGVCRKDKPFAAPSYYRRYYEGARKMGLNSGLAVPKLALPKRAAAVFEHRRRP